MSVRIVTDSACDIPEDLIRDHDIRIVPLTVRFGDDVYTSGVDLSTHEFWHKVRSSNEFPSTAAPSAGDFEAAYRELLDSGAESVVSIHLSSKLSATWQAATVAAKEVGTDRVSVIDSLQVSAPQGLMVLRAAELAGKGMPVADVVSEVEAYGRTLRVYFVIDTLEYLRRGGRIGGAQALLGTMLKVKPVLGLEGGVVQPVGRVRTRSKSLEYLAGMPRDAGSVSDLRVVSGDAPDIQEFLAVLSDVAHVTPDAVWELGPVVGAHAGPGVVGVVFSAESG